MKRYNLRGVASRLLSLIAMATIASCADSFELTNEIVDTYTTPTENYAYLSDATGNRTESDMYIWTDGDTSTIKVNLSKDASSSLTAKMELNSSALESYNSENGTSYTLLPAESYELGDMSLTDTRCIEGDITFKSNNTLEEAEVYALPITVTFNDSNVETSQQGELMLLVRDYTIYPPSTAKSNGLMMFDYVAMNSINPLSSLCFTLKNEKRYFFDAVILSAQTLAFDTETQLPYLATTNNNNIHVLSNYDTYIKPLQEAGMKVLLSILGNASYIGGQANLSDENIEYAATMFADFIKEKKLDGISFDDEYTSYSYDDEFIAANPGLQTPSYQAHSKFMCRVSQEIRKNDPDAMVVCFAWSGSYSGYPQPVTFDGVEYQPTDYLDYALSNYGSIPVEATRNYMGNSRITPYSQQLSDGTTNTYFPSASTIQITLDEGYAGQMFWALKPDRDSNWAAQLAQLELTTDILFDDELIFTDNPSWTDHWGTIE